MDSERLQKPFKNRDELKEKLSIDHFDLNAILRGAQLTIVGGQFHSATTIIPCYTLEYSAD